LIEAIEEVEPELAEVEIEELGAEAIEEVGSAATEEDLEELTVNFLDEESAAKKGAAEMVSEGDLAEKPAAEEVVEDLDEVTVMIDEDSASTDAAAYVEPGSKDEPGDVTRAFHGIKSQGLAPVTAPPTAPKASRSKSVVSEDDITNVLIGATPAEEKAIKDQMAELPDMTNMVLGDQEVPQPPPPLPPEEVVLEDLAEEVHAGSSAPAARKK